jgi:hypothetical protein
VGVCVCVCVCVCVGGCRNECKQESECRCKLSLNVFVCVFRNGDSLRLLHVFVYQGERESTRARETERLNEIEYVTCMRFHERKAQTFTHLFIHAHILSFLLGFIVKLLCSGFRV